MEDNNNKAEERSKALKILEENMSHFTDDYIGKVPKLKDWMIDAMIEYSNLSKGEWVSVDKAKLKFGETYWLYVHNSMPSYQFKEINASEYVTYGEYTQKTCDGKCFDVHGNTYNENNVHSKVLFVMKYTEPLPPKPITNPKERK